MSQTSFGPVSGGSRLWRRAPRRVVRGSTLNARRCPFTSSVRFRAPATGRAPVSASAATVSASGLSRRWSAKAAPAPATPTPFRNCLRLGSCLMVFFPRPSSRSSAIIFSFALATTDFNFYSYLRLNATAIAWSQVRTARGSGWVIVYETQTRPLAAGGSDLSLDTQLQLLFRLQLFASRDETDESRDGVTSSSSTRRRWPVR